MVYFKLLQMLIGSRPKLWSLQSVIPKLPVPSLEHTCEQYLRSVEPLLTTEEFAATKKAVHEFHASPDAIGHQLNAALIQRYQDPSIDNWLSEYWERFAYLRTREPLQISSNWYGVDRPHPAAQDLLSRASMGVVAILTFKEMLDKQELDPIRLYGAFPLCMEQYRRMFNTSRVPDEVEDKIQHDPSTTHLAVVYHGQFYTFSAYNADGTPIDRRQARDHLQAIMNDVKEKEEAGEIQPYIGALTSLERASWAKFRAQLIADGNQENLEKIEKAIMLLALEDDAPDSVQALSEAAAMGDCTNRWFDKSGTFIFFQNGRFAGNFEHTWGDAPVMVNLLTYYYGVEDEKGVLKSSSAASSSSNQANNIQFDQIKWNTTETIQTQINEAKALYQQNTVEQGVRINVLQFEHFGKGLIKKAKLSPDGYCQMAIQLAYYRMYKKLCLTYESSHTRIFRLGRTETVRSASNEALQFCEAMENEQISDAQRVQLLRTAVSSHIAYMRMAMSGQGVDRHLMGLRVAAAGAGLQGDAMPAIFRDKAWQFNYQLSTSQTPGYLSSGGGFMPTAEDGYGVSYVVNEDWLIFHITDWKKCESTNANQFAESLENALMDVRAVLLTDKSLRRNLSRTNLEQMSQLEN
eukprot:CAMPEP_0201552422 /NCGR_PEP_ID=MMETSP0173_2-20130828/16046_1 /ASSEMBLY_ACC=CAM_ASM_000268 /TAXON_ID=218659 /ORGANISM="Vexillifera sp., Strain DIVA3 564/2" /LENGTH=633 /DNA_ID=CAMNT_0047962907 /DNA_START=318 /DNA_END=2219 /DNA_ORIENTATION=+